MRILFSRRSGTRAVTIASAYDRHREDKTPHLFLRTKYCQPVPTNTKVQRLKIHQPARTVRVYKHASHPYRNDWS
jgi:hypothetical protein